MPTDTSDQQITRPVDADTADNPVAFVNMLADVEPRLVRKYTNEADRTARMVALSENDISTLATENRADIYDGAAHISLFTRSLILLRKTADQTLTVSSTVLQNITQLVAAMPTAGVFGFRGLIYYSGPAAGDIKFAFTIPAGGAVSWHGLGLVTGSATTGDANFAVTVGSGSTVAFGCNAAGSVNAFQLEGAYQAGGTAGNLQLQAAQNTADAGNTVVHSNSRLEVWRIS